jgi:hypothetical protein
VLAAYGEAKRQSWLARKDKAIKIGIKMVSSHTTYALTSIICTFSGAQVVTLIIFKCNIFLKIILETSKKIK